MEHPQDPVNLPETHLNLSRLAWDLSRRETGYPKPFILKELDLV